MRHFMELNAQKNKNKQLFLMVLFDEEKKNQVNLIILMGEEEKLYT
jgi:hypothetical protein